MGLRGGIAIAALVFAIVACLAIAGAPPVAAEAASTAAAQGNAAANSTAALNITELAVIYGEWSCPHCRATYNYLASVMGQDRVLFCDITANATCYSYYSKVVNEAYGGTMLVPVTIFIYMSTVTGIVMGEISPSTVPANFVSTFLKPNNSNEIPVYAGTNVIGRLNVTSQQDFIATHVPLGMVPQGATNPVVGLVTTPWQELVGIVPLLVALALLDSANPCALSIFVSFVAAAVGGRRGSLGPAVAFVAVIYAGYVALGLGLYELFGLIPRWAAGAVLVAFATYTALDAFRGSSGPACRACEKLGAGTAAGYVAAAALALASVAVLLPCAAGPLATFVALARGFPLPIMVSLLMAYNVLFVAPMLAMLAIARTARGRKRIAAWLGKYSRPVAIVTSLVLFAAGLYLLSSY